MPASGRADAKVSSDPEQRSNTAIRLLRPEELTLLLQRLARQSSGLNKLEVEIGCGNGHFLIEYCRFNPCTGFIGVEIKKKRCLKAQAKIERQRIKNAWVVYGGAEEVLGYLPDGSARREEGETPSRRNARSMAIAPSETG